MLSRERVIAVIQHKKPDRIPIYGWLQWNMAEKIDKAFGSYTALEDKYEFDIAHLFGDTQHILGDDVWTRLKAGAIIEPPEFATIPLGNPNQERIYTRIKEGIRHHKEQRGRFVYVQTPGIFEGHNGIFGIENHLAYLLMFEDELHQIYQRHAEWCRQFAMNCLDLGVDMVHISDDWDAQQNLMFNPQIWWKLIYPYHKITTDAVKGRGGYMSLHSDGNINSVVEMFRDGSLIFCTTHFVQSHCTIEELILAYDLVYDLIRSNGRGGK